MKDFMQHLNDNKQIDEDNFTADSYKEGSFKMGYYIIKNNFSKSYGTSHISAKKGDVIQMSPPSNYINGAQSRAKINSMKIWNFQTKSFDVLDHKLETKGGKDAVDFLLEIEKHFKFISRNLSQKVKDIIHANVPHKFNNTRSAINYIKTLPPKTKINVETF